jgi:acetyl-CoA carboxylase biotin carboxylase subunit
MVTGLDLVKLQMRVAEGQPLPFAQSDLRQRGHAVECRVYAEDPDRRFLPSPGRITLLRTPSGPGVRDDSGVYEGCEVPIHYDPLISKLVAWGADRGEALARMRRAVSEYTVGGITTTLPFFARVLREPHFVAGDFDTGYVDRLFAAPADELPRDVADVAVIAAAVRAWREGQKARLEAAPAAAARSAWRESGWREAGGR